MQQIGELRTQPGNVVIFADRLGANDLRRGFTRRLEEVIQLDDLHTGIGRLEGARQCAFT